MKAKKTVSRRRRVDEKPVPLADGELGSASGGRENAVVDRLVTANRETASRSSSAICTVTCRWCYVIRP